MCVFAAIPQAGDAYSMVGRTIILYICSLLSSDNRLRRFIIGYRCFMTAMPLFLALVMCDLKVSPLSRMTPRYFASDFHSMSSLNMRSGGGISGLRLVKRTATLLAALTSILQVLNHSSNASSAF